RIVLTLPVEAFAVAVEDSLPAGWVVGTINNGGGYDAVNHKVKWFLPSPPFPAEVSYELTPDNAASGRGCLSGIVSIDGTSGAICGDDCLDYQCCSYMAGETPQDVCAWCAAGNCSACTTGACEDGTVSLCEVIAYGCAWVRGCNDDISGVTRAAYIWRNGECYCWDGVVQNFVPRECGSGGPCCTVGDTASVSQEFSPSLGSALASVGSARLQRGLREWDVSIDVVPMLGTSASAAELVLPKGWKVVAIGEDGAFDSANGKIKWGPYFGDTARVLTATVRPGGKRSDAKAGRLSGTLEAQAMNAMARGLYGTVSFDGVNVPINIER
ncbi:MAG: hypothetical protein Q7R41_05065, partial [Phycisphaerales bacterium]|nr:hypothetical protein [Phycisphaerales bacterium]